VGLNFGATGPPSREAALDVNAGGLILGNKEQREALHLAVTDPGVLTEPGVTLVDIDGQGGVLFAREHSVLVVRGTVDDWPSN
jgi:hypothetical protein